MDFNPFYILPVRVALYPYCCVWIVLLGMHISPNCVFVAPIKLGLDDKYQPTDGARPPFLIPPHVLVRLTIDAAFLAFRDPL
jgi:hypothetical protein